MGFIMRNVLLSLSLSLVALPIGCGGASSQSNVPVAPNQRFALSTAGSEDLGAAVDPEGISGDVVRLGRYTDEQALRGDFRGKFVNARIEGNAVKGLVGEDRIEVEVKRDGGVVTSRGVVYSRPATITMDEQKLSAKIDRCELALVRNAQDEPTVTMTYKGLRTCEGIAGSQNIVVQVGQGLMAWGDAERMAALSLLLIRQR